MRLLWAAGRLPSGIPGATTNFKREQHMNTDIEKQAQQLELAAQLLRTGHPWECFNQRSDSWGTPMDGDSVSTCLAHSREIRPVLVTPDDGRKLNNPDNLTAEQVGVGYKLTLEEQMDGKCHSEGEWWNGQSWVKPVNDTGWFWPKNDTIRIPLSTPWPEAKPAWTMPEPPAGKQWHKPGALPQQDWEDGWRPLLLGEEIMEGDEVWSWGKGPWAEPSWADKKVTGRNHPFRTKRPLPVEPVKPEPKYGPLGPEDVPVGSSFRHSVWKKNKLWVQPIKIALEGVVWAELSYEKDVNLAFIKWDSLVESWQILRPGQTEWQPCRKEVQP